MGCKTYKQIAEELNLEEDSSLEELVQMTREAEWADLVDVYEGTHLDILDGLNSAKPWLNKQRVEITDLEKTDTGYSMKYKYLTSDKVYSKKIGEYSPLTFSQEGYTFDVSARELDTFYSDQEFINEGKAGYDSRVVDVMNSPEQMKEIGNELADISDLDKSTKDYILGMLDTVVTGVKGVLPSINVHLNEQGKKTGGYIQFNGSNADVYVSVGDKGEKSPLEVYVHELMHAATKFAIESRDPALSNVIRQMEQIREKVIDRGKVDEKTLDYISDSKVGLHEFVSYAMTNPGMIEELKSFNVGLPKKENHPDWASKLTALVRELMEKIVKFAKGPKYVDSNKNANDSMVELVTALAKANNRQMESKRNRAFERVMATLVKPEAKIKEWLSKGGESVKKRPMPTMKNKGLWESTKFLSKMAARSLVDENAKRSLEFVMGSYKGLRPEGSIMTVLRDMSESDNFQDAVEHLGLMSQNIDQQREMIFHQTVAALKAGFDRSLTGRENEVLATMIFDTDLSSVYHLYDNIGDMIKDKKVLDTELKRLKGELKIITKPNEYNYMEAQAQGLGWFMVTGQASVAQMFNAHNIASMLGSKSRRDADPKVEELVDVIATLEAIKVVDEDTRVEMAVLMEEESNGVDLLVAHHSGHKETSKKALFSSPSDKMKVIKGYSKEIYDKDTNFQIAPKADAAKLKKMGWKKVDKDLGNHALDSSGVEMAMYTTTLDTRQNLHRVALRFTDTGRKGTSIREVHRQGGKEFHSLKAENDILKLERAMYKEIMEMEKGTYKAKKEHMGIAPMLGNGGRPKDFRYMMNKQSKKELLGMDRRVVNIMGRMQASTFDKEVTATYNEEAMKIIVEDAEKNFKKKGLAKNTKEYIKIEADSNNDEVRDLWGVVPSSIKNKYPKGFMIRRDMMHSFLGYRELSIGDAPGFKYLPEIGKRGLTVAESIWKEIVKISKVDIIIRVPGVLIGNIVSNFMYSAMSGSSPLKIAQLQLQGVKELNKYLENNKELIRLQGLVQAGKGTSTIERKIKALQNVLDTSSAKDLMDAGFYMSIIEELGAEEFAEQGKISKFIDDKTKSMPSFVNDGIHMLYITDKTKVFKTINLATQYSDFVARYAQYHLMREKGVSKEKSLKTVRDAFINYNKPNSRLVEYANQMGLVMFTKYFTRIQKAIKEHAREHPIKVLLAVLGQDLVIGDVDDMYDQSIATKDLGNIFYNPLDTLTRAITPSGAEAIAWALK